MAAFRYEGMNEQVRKYAVILSYIALLNKEIARNAERIFLAVKPQMMDGVLE